MGGAPMAVSLMEFEPGSTATPWLSPVSSLSMAPSSKEGAVEWGAEGSAKADPALKRSAKSTLFKEMLIADDLFYFMFRGGDRAGGEEHSRADQNKQRDDEKRQARIPGFTLRALWAMAVRIHGHMLLQYNFKKRWQTIP
jgi:hypothetical protein